MIVYHGATTRLLPDSEGTKGEDGRNALKGILTAMILLAVKDE